MSYTPSLILQKRLLALKSDSLVESHKAAVHSADCTITSATKNLELTKKKLTEAEEARKLLDIQWTEIQTEIAQLEEAIEKLLS